jgi:hypothetical protein
MYALMLSITIQFLENSLDETPTTLFWDHRTHDELCNRYPDFCG